MESQRLGKHFPPGRRKIRRAYLQTSRRFHSLAQRHCKSIVARRSPARRSRYRCELLAAVRKQDMRMGLYYSGGYDWTFAPGPIRVAADYQSVKPQSPAYGAYVDAQMRELIARYHPSLLWNDIDYPKSGHPLQIMADYYNTAPGGVVDDRFGVPHSDFKSPEYQTLDKISPVKWEECRGLGRSFGFNRAEGEAESIAPQNLIYLLVDIVSKNGNLLLDVGPEADGTIPPVQMSRLQALGDWLQQNGEAIYGTTPWTRASGITGEGIAVRFTRKGDALYATLLGSPNRLPSRFSPCL
jgi:alpha-L-fucosidase